MKIKKQSSRKPYIIFSAIALLMVVASLTCFFLLANSSDESTSKRSTPVLDEKREGAGGSKIKNNSEPTGSDQAKDKESTPKTIEDKAPAPSSDRTYIDTPISNPPSNDDPFPISNEHYRIEQLSHTKYRITLFPIANNPEYSDYDAQLKAYKNEALSYLKQRFDSTSSFTYEWSPTDAKNL